MGINIVIYNCLIFIFNVCMTKKKVKSLKFKKIVHTDKKINIITHILASYSLRSGCKTAKL